MIGLSEVAVVARLCAERHPERIEWRVLCSFMIGFSAAKRLSRMADRFAARGQVPLQPATSTPGGFQDPSPAGSTEGGSVLGQ